jgi:hypothetical protein
MDVNGVLDVPLEGKRSIFDSTLLYPFHFQIDTFDAFGLFPLIMTPKLVLNFLRLDSTAYAIDTPACTYAFYSWFYSPTYEDR